MRVPSIRTAEVRDCCEIAKLMLELGYPTSPELLERKLKEFEGRDYDQVFVAELDEEIIGVISCHITSLFHQEEASGRITSLVVKSGLAGTGIGSRLVQTAEEYFKNCNCIKSEVTSGNIRTGAHEFYISCGYARDEQRFLKVYN